MASSLVTLNKFTSEATKDAFKPQLVGLFSSFSSYGEALPKDLRGRAIFSAVKKERLDVSLSKWI